MGSNCEMRQRIKQTLTGSNTIPYSVSLQWFSLRKANLHDPTVWLQCYNIGQSGHLYSSNRSSLGSRMFFCYNYNRDTYRFKSCKYAHCCMSCRGFHPELKCPNSSILIILNNLTRKERHHLVRLVHPVSHVKTQDSSVIIVMKSH